MFDAATKLLSCLVPPFEPKHIKAQLIHYSGVIEALQRRQWQLAITRAGQFVEATMKALVVYTGGTLPPARQFKVGTVIQSLRQIPAGSQNDAIRITIPRACEFVYYVASNRGARHDPDEVDPNEMDAHVVSNVTAWVLAELVRYAQRRAASPGEVASLLAAVVERHYPIIEEVDGRTYFHVPHLSARQLALLALWHKHPARVSRTELLSTLERHRIKQNNAATALSRIASVVDQTPEGLRLLRPGLQEVEEIIGANLGRQK